MTETNDAAKNRREKRREKKGGGVEGMQSQHNDKALFYKYKII